MNIKRINKNKSGFTLIEMIVVIILIGVVASVSLPLLDTTNYRIGYFKDECIAFLKLAKKYAISGQREIQVVQSTCRLRGTNHLCLKMYRRDTDGQFSVEMQHSQRTPVVILEEFDSAFESFNLYFDRQGKPYRNGVLLEESWRLTIPPTRINIEPISGLIYEG